MQYRQIIYNIIKTYVSHQLMNKILKKITPVFVKSIIARNIIKIQPYPRDEIEFKAAETIDELRQAYEILGKTYIEEKYSNTKRRVLIYNTFKNSATFIAKKNNIVIGTMSVFPDNKTFGLPLDSDYKNNIDKLRNKGHRIAEVGGFAIERNKRGTNQRIAMEFNRILIRYLLFLKIDSIIIGINPKHEHIYRGIFFFKSLGKKHNNYKFVNNVPVIPLQLNIKKIKNKYKKTYNKKKDKKNIYKFFFDKNVKYDFTKNKPISWDKKVWDYFIDDILKNTPNSMKKQILFLFNSL